MVKIGSLVLAHTAHPFTQFPKSYALQWARYSPKSAPTHWGICTPSETWFLQPSQAYNNNNKWSKQFDIGLHRRRKWIVQSYSPGGTDVPSHVCTLAPPGAYD